MKSTSAASNGSAMHHDHVSTPRSHDHGPPRFEGHERRAWAVTTITATMMVVEIIAGTLTHSLALTADGWHMATHAGALGLSALAYWYARTRSREASFTFGTGKVYALAGYSNAVILILVAGMMIAEAVRRLITPEAVQFAEALPIAVVGLVVNLVSALLLDPHHDPPAPAKKGDHDRHDHGPHDHDHHDHGHHNHAPHDHNLRAAYLHVAADAVTSLLAIAALLGGRYFGLRFLDPLTAILGAVVIMKWGFGLGRTAGLQLLDAVPAPDVAASIRSRVESIDDARVLDLRLWELGPGQRGCIVSLITSTPRPLEEYRAAIFAAARVDHLTVEVDRCPHEAP